MKKAEFEQYIRNNCHEYLYIKNNENKLNSRGCIGCIYKNNNYEIYSITKTGRYFFIGTYNNEEDAYDYLLEIFDILHIREINKLLDSYFDNFYNEKLINYYKKHDFCFVQELHRRTNSVAKKYYLRNLNIKRKNYHM